MINESLHSEHRKNTYIGKREFFAIIHTGNCYFALRYIKVIVNVFTKVTDVCWKRKLQEVFCFKINDFHIAVVLMLLLFVVVVVIFDKCIDVNIIF